MIGGYLFRKTKYGTVVGELAEAVIGHNAEWEEGDQLTFFYGRQTVDEVTETWNMDPELLEAAIKDRMEKTGKKPAAIVPVALYGMPYKADRIMEIANKYGIPVVEDAAEGFGSKYKGLTVLPDTNNQTPI